MVFVLGLDLILVCSFSFFLPAFASWAMSQSDMGIATTAFTTAVTKFGHKKTGLVALGFIRKPREYSRDHYIKS